jgi:thiol-disulfide isomerase/thioredoxin
MKIFARTLPAILLLGALAVVSAPAAAQPVSLQGLGGPALTNQELSQGNAVLVIWASWSPRCRDVVDRVNGLQGKWSGKAHVYSVNFNEDRSAAEGFLSGKKSAVPVVLDADGEFSKKNAITFLPGLIVYQGGKVIYAGRLPDNPDDLLAKLLGT